MPVGRNTSPHTVPQDPPCWKFQMITMILILNTDIVKPTN